MIPHLHAAIVEAAAVLVGRRPHEARVANVLVARDVVGDVGLTLARVVNRESVDLQVRVRPEVRLLLVRVAVEDVAPGGGYATVTRRLRDGYTASCLYGWR